MVEPSGEVEPRPESPLARGLAGVGLTLAGLRWGDAGAVAVAGPLPQAERFAGVIAAELRGKAPLVRDGALAAARVVRPDITEDQLWDELVEDPKLRALMLRVMDAAKCSASPGELRWLGDVLGRVAVEKERLTEGQMLVAALNDLQPPMPWCSRRSAAPPTDHHHLPLSREDEPPADHNHPNYRTCR